MYLTVDCAQFESGKIAFYEFCNSEMTNLIHYSLEKFNLLSKIADITYLIYYSIEKIERLFISQEEILLEIKRPLQMVISKISTNGILTKTM